MNLRCIWCSLSSFEENPVNPASGLCAACSRILGNSNWKLDSVSQVVGAAEGTDNAPEAEPFVDDGTATVAE